MKTPPIADVVEVQQLLAGYAVGMTKDDYAFSLDDGGER